jgi:hypothetical protein
MSDEPGAHGALDAAMQRLDRAVAQLERRIGGLLTRAGGGDLDAARGRERDLEAAGQQASLALGRAIADIRAALGDAPEATTAGDDDDDDDDDGGADERRSVNEEA